MIETTIAMAIAAIVAIFMIYFIVEWLTNVRSPSSRARGRAFWSVVGDAKSNRRENKK